MTTSPVHRGARRHSARRRRGGFTLIELMISVAIVLVLMLGINYVFSTTARTIGSGMAVSSASRELRSARRVLQSDFDNMVARAEMPAMIITSETFFAFRDRQDQLADVDGFPYTYDVDGDTSNGDEIDLRVAPYTNLYNFRRHRFDRISFFANHSTDSYRRQTGDDTTFVGPERSAQAWISYGPLRQPNNGMLQYWKPGAGDQNSNQNNFYASQFTLARRVMLLMPAINDGVRFQHRSDLSGIAFGALSMTKTAGGATAWNRETLAPYAQQRQWRTEESRLDLALGTIAAHRTMLNTLDSPPPAPSPTGPPSAWWQDVETGVDARIYEPFTAPAGPLLNYMFWGKPFVDRRNFAASIPQQTRETALTTPIFIPGVSQFIVEVAGDFYDQSNVQPPPTGGAPPTPEPVGVIDYEDDGTGQRIRWYGMPRDMTGGDANGDGDPSNDVGDVRPLVVQPTVNGTAPLAARFDNRNGVPQHQRPQRQVGNPSVTPPRPTIWAWGPTMTNGDPTLATVTAVGPPATYAPGAYAQTPNNVRPKLIRITMEVIDQNGRLPDGQRAEYVFTVK